MKILLFNNRSYNVESSNWIEQGFKYINVEHVMDHQCFQTKSTLLFAQNMSFIFPTKQNWNNNIYMI